MATADTQDPAVATPASDPAENLAQELGVDGPPAPAAEVAVSPDDSPDPQGQDVQTPPSPNEDIEDVEKQTEPRVWKFAGEFNIQRGNEVLPQMFEEEYIQKPLSYFAFLEFAGLLAKKIEEAMAGEDGLTIQSVIETSEGALPFMVDGKNINAVIEKKDFDGVDAFMKGLFKLASYVPDVIEECQFIWLRVPRRERAFLREIWGRSPEDGGLTMNEGEEMMTVFIDQNYEELEAFFVERLPRLARTAQAARKRMQKIRAELPAGSQRSRPWRHTAEPTPSQ